MRVRKKFLKSLVSMLLILSMVIGHFTSVQASIESKDLTSTDEITESILGTDVEAVTGSAISITNNKFTGDGFEVEFNVTSQWEGAFNGSITITNTSDAVIDNWLLEFDFGYEITNIWNASVQSYKDGIYIIENSTWNQDILAGESVSFGFTVTGTGTQIKYPNYYVIPVIGIIADKNAYIF